MPYPFTIRFMVAMAAMVLSIAYFGYERYLAATDPMRAEKPRLRAESSTALAKLSPSRVVMFGTSWCPYCAQARALFAQHGISYVEFDIERHHEGALFAKEHLKLRTIPNIVVGSRLLVGFSETEILAALKEN